MVIHVFIVSLQYKKNSGQLSKLNLSTNNLKKVLRSTSVNESSCFKPNDSGGKMPKKLTFTESKSTTKFRNKASKADKLVS